MVFQFSSIRLCRIALLLLLVPLAAAGQPTEQPPEVLAAVHGVFRPLPNGLSAETSGAPESLLPANAPPGLEVPPRDGVVRYRRVSIDFDLLAARIAGAPGAAGFLPGIDLNPGPIVFNFFDDIVIRVEDPVLSRTPNLDREGWVLAGRVGDSLEMLHLVVHTAQDGSIDAVAGAASLNGRRVDLSTDSPGVYLVEELAPPIVEEDDVVLPERPSVDADSPVLREFAPKTEPRPQGPRFLADPSPDTRLQTGSTVDVLVLTTSTYRSARGGTSGTDSRIGVLAAQTNTALSNSGVSHRIAVRTFHADWFTINQKDPNLVVSGLSVFYDGLRAAYGADLLHLVGSHPMGSTSGICGIASIGPSETGSVGVSADTSSGCVYTFTHELGHNFGLWHDRHQEFVVADSSGSAGSRFGYGFSRADLRNVSGLSCWHTVMAYNSHCLTDGALSISRIQYFSNLTVTHPTTAEALGRTGATETRTAVGPADAASVLNTNMPTVAAFESKVTSPSYFDLRFSTTTATLSPSNACYGAPVTVSATVVNRGNATSPSYTVDLVRQWRSSSSAQWPLGDVLSTTTGAALSAGGSASFFLPGNRAISAGQERFYMTIIPSAGTDPIGVDHTVWTATADLNTGCQDTWPAVQVTGAAGFNFRVYSRRSSVPPLIEIQPHDLTLSWTPTTQYTRMWLFFHNPGSTSATPNGFELRTFFDGVGGSASVRLPLSVWTGVQGGLQYFLAARNDGGYPALGARNPDSPIALTATVWYRGSSSSLVASDLPPGAEVLANGSRFRIPVELEPIEPALAEELVDIGMRLAPGGGPPLELPLQESASP